MSNRPLRSTPIEVLLVEDNPAEAQLTIRLLHDAKIRNRVHLAEDAEQALDFLHRRGLHVDAPRPDLILLDLNLPKKDGRGLAAEIKGDEHLRHIPLVVLTGSTTDDDVTKSYQLHANAFVAKPVDPAEFLVAINAIGRFWLEIVRLP